MTVLHIREQGAVVRRDVEQIRVTQKDKETQKQQLLAQSPVRELTQLVLYGNIQVTTQATALLLEHEVDLIFLSMFGKYRGRLTKSGSHFAKLRHAQLRFSGDERKSLAVAQQIVQAKLANQRNTLQTVLDNHSEGTAQVVLTRTITGIETMRRASSGAHSADELRGFEGKAGAYYFEAIRSLLAPPWQFKGRNYHPALDPFNALLSFGYALLLKDTTTAIQLVGLDPYLGCLHALEYGRPSLTLDLMEEFRPLAVDRVLLGLVAAGTITPTAFTFTGRQDRPVELGETLIPTVIKVYEQALSHTIRHTPSGNDNTLRRCLELQAHIFARVVMGERGEYAGVVA